MLPVQCVKFVARRLQLGYKPSRFPNPLIIARSQIFIGVLRDFLAPQRGRPIGQNSNRFRSFATGLDREGCRAMPKVNRYGCRMTILSRIPFPRGRLSRPLLS